MVRCEEALGRAMLQVQENTGEGQPRDLREGSRKCHRDSLEPPAMTSRSGRARKKVNTDWNENLVSWDNSSVLLHVHVRDRRILRRGVT